MNYLILGIGTDIGKSFLVENLCRISKKITAIKPVATGCDDADKNSDPARILTALGLKISKNNLDAISPIFPTNSHKSVKPLGLRYLRKIIAKNRKALPIYALGGVNTTNLKSLQKLEISGFGAINFFSKN